MHTGMKITACRRGTRGRKMDASESFSYEKGRGADSPYINHSLLSDYKRSPQYVARVILARCVVRGSVLRIEKIVGCVETIGRHKK